MARTKHGLAVLLAWSAVARLSAAGVTVDELNKVIGAAVASHRSDDDTARQISAVELSERITEDTLAALQARAPGSRTAATLEELAAQSAFLNPPRAERSHEPPPSKAEQKRIFERAANYVVSYAHRLPNLLCTESILRFDNNPVRSTDGMRSLGKLHFLDAITAQVTYSQGAETVAVKAVDGKASVGSRVFGNITSGEFGNTIISLMQQRTKTKASWSHWEVLHGKRLAVFHYSVAKNNSQYLLNFKCAGTEPKSMTPAYDGLLFIEAETGEIVRITRETVGIPAKFPTRHASTAVEYGRVSISGTSYMLPIRSATDTDNPLGCDQTKQTLRIHSLNETRFSGYRLFHAESNLVASTQTDKAPDSRRAFSFPPLPAAVNSEPARPELPPAPAVPESIQPAKQPVFSLPQPPAFQERDGSNDNSFATHATFRERVSIVTVPVVVRDREGHTVGGLTKDDFELMDNGKRQVITNFSEQRAPERDVPAGSQSTQRPMKTKQFQIVIWSMCLTTSI